MYLLKQMPIRQMQKFLFMASMNHPDQQRKKPDGKIPQRFPKQSEAIPAVSGESLKHSTSKTVDQKGSGFLPRTGTKQQQMFNYLGIIVIFMASFYFKERRNNKMKIILSTIPRYHFRRGYCTRSECRRKTMNQMPS